MDLPTPCNHREVCDIVRHERQPISLAGLKNHVILKDVPVSLEQRLNGQTLNAQSFSDHRRIMMVKDESHAEAAC